MIETSRALGAKQKNTLPDAKARWLTQLYTAVPHAIMR